MRARLPLLVSPAMAKALTAAIAVILLASNFTIINAQQQGQQLTSQPGEIENRTTTATATTTTATTFQSTNDGFRVQVPQGWIIQDLNNTDSALSEEATQGYEMLAQLCSEGEEQQQQGGGAVLSTNASGGSTNSTSNSCQGAQEEVIHIIRYPNVETTIQEADNLTTNNNMTTNNLTTYHLQKLQEVGYIDIEIVNSTQTTVNLTIPQTNQTVAAMPAKLVEMTYNTYSAPDETRRGYFLLTATAATLPDLGTPKGYSILYEGSSTSAAEIATTGSSSLPPTPLPPVVEQIFGSFELIAAPEVGQLIAQQQEAEGAETAEDGDDDDDDDDEGAGGDDDDEGGGGGDDDDEGGAGGGGGGDDDDEGGAGGGGGGVDANDIVDSVMDRLT